MTLVLVGQAKNTRPATAKQINTKTKNNDDAVELRDLRSAPTRSRFTVLDTRSPRPDSFLKWYTGRLRRQTSCSAARSYAFDIDEFEAVKWFSFNDIPFEKSDPHMKRFIAKLKEVL